MCRKRSENFRCCELVSFISIFLVNPFIIRYFILLLFNKLLSGAMTIMDPIDKWLKIEELAAYLKMSRTKLYQMAQKGEIPASKIGNQWRFDRYEIDDWMKRQRVTSADRNV